MKSSRIIFNTAILIATLGLNACDTSDTDEQKDQAEVATPAKIVAVVTSGFSVLRRFPGTLEASSRVDLAFRVGGQLSQLPAQAGLEFKAGELLAGLDETDYRNSLKQHQARYDLAKIQHDQANKLLKQKLTSQLQYDQSVAELKSARAARDQARDNLNYTHLLAPFDGIVGRVDIKNYQTVQAKAPIIQFQNIESMDVRFSIPESVITQLKQIDDPAEIEAICGLIHFSSQPGKVFKACHKEHESVPDALTRNYSAVFTLVEKPAFSILPGMSVSIELDFTPFLPESANINLLLPVEAVFEKGGKKWVWQVDEGMRARQVEVEIGGFTGDMLQITKGLDLNNKVIAAGVSYAREGMLVKPLVKERGL